MGSVQQQTTNKQTNSLRNKLQQQQFLFKKKQHKTFKTEGRKTRESTIQFIKALTLVKTVEKKHHEVLMSNGSNARYTNIFKYYLLIWEGGELRPGGGRKERDYSK